MVNPIVGPRVQLQQGVVYRARLRLDDAVQCMAPLSAVANVFVDLGFSDVRVWDDPDDLPKDWPSNQREVSGGWLSCGRWLEGTWAVPTTELQKPPEILAVWEHARPIGPPAPPVIVPPPPTRPDPQPGPPAPPRPTVPKNCGSNVRQAAVILAQAWGLEGRKPTDLTNSVVQLLLGMSWFEGGFGCAKYGDAVINNWGAMHCRAPDAQPKPGDLWIGCHMWKDTSTHGRYDVAFRVYATQLDGARDFLRSVLGRKGTMSALSSGDPKAFAQALYDSSYYGDTDKSSGAKRVREYTDALILRGKQVAKGLGQPVAFGTSAASSHAIVWVVGGIAVTATAAGAAYYYLRAA